MRVESGRGAHSGNCAHVIPGARTDVVVSPLSLWTVSTGKGLYWKCDQSSKSESGGHPGDCVHVARGKISGKVGSPWRMWTCDPRCRVW